MLVSKLHVCEPSKLVGSSESRVLDVQMNLCPIKWLLHSLCTSTLQEKSVYTDSSL